MKILLLVNSDLGGKGTFGNRVIPITQKLKKERIKYKCIARQDYTNETNTICPIPFKNLIPKILTAIPIYIWKRFPSRPIKVKIFEIFAKKYSLNYHADIIHSRDFTPNLYKKIKKKYPKTILIQDVTIALNKSIKEINKKDKLFHKFEEQTPNFIIKSLQYIDYFIAPSLFVKDSLKKYGISDNKIFINQFGVDTNRFKPKLKYKININKIRFCFVGNINNRKGIKYLIKSRKQLYQENNIKNIELHLYGRLYPETKKYLMNTKENNIFYHGFCDVSQELPKNDIYIFPSTLEGSSKSILEAMACGLPIISTYNSGPIYQDGKEGFIIPTQDIDAIKEKIQFFIDNPKQIQIMGTQARKLVEKYTRKHYANNIINIYQKLLNEKNK